MAEDLQQKIISLCKRRGFVYPSSEIYGGWESSYDFGPLGAILLRNLRNIWWKEFVTKQADIVGLDSSIISHPKVWEASGHTQSFSNAMVEDIVTHKRYRADHLVDEKLGIMSDGSSLEEFDEIIAKNNILSPDGNKLSKARYFNQLVEAEIGTTTDSKNKAYLRGETCQPIFYNFKLVKDSLRLKIPFGIAQIGKAFRNEIKVGPYFFRTREFEQMEIEMFIKPEDKDYYVDKFKKWSIDWLISIGLAKNKLRLRDQDFKERAHYNKVATDVEYEFPFGWKEFQGIHYRGDWDLSRHSQYSGQDLSVKDSEEENQYIPHVVEYSIGLNRLMLVLLFDAYREIDNRVVLSFQSNVAPYRAAVFPLLKNKPDLVHKADKIYKDLLSKGYSIAWDDRGNIGKRYLSQDEIGTPSCITVDFQTLEDNTVTLRDRDTTSQIRVEISELENILKN